jgi:hypothetical protein
MKYQLLPITFLVNPKINALKRPQHNCGGEKVKATS